MTCGYVYILHFDSKLCHAQHYVGCTRDPRGRFVTHAHGRGSRIVAAHLAAGGTFRVGALGSTTRPKLRSIERNLKNWHGPARMCVHCSRSPLRIPGTTPYPLEAVPWPLTSPELASLEPGPAEITVRFGGPEDAASHGMAVRALMKANKEELGFIPAGGAQGLTQLFDAGRIVLCLIDGILRGYAAFTETEFTTTVHQCVVDDSQRGCGLGRRMIDFLRGSRENKAFRAKVREDLPANSFWERVGFRVVGRDTHETSGRTLNVYACDPEPYQPY